MAHHRARRLSPARGSSSASRSSGASGSRCRKPPCCSEEMPMPPKAAKPRQPIAPNLPDDVAARVRQVVDERRHLPGALLPVLHGVQDALGYVPDDAVPLIAHELNLSRAEVHGVVSFYHHFRTHAPG